MVISTMFHSVLWNGTVSTHLLLFGEKAHHRPSLTALSLLVVSILFNVTFDSDHQTNTLLATAVCHYMCLETPQFENVSSNCLKM